MNIINKNGVEIIAKNCPMTPRTSVCCYFAIDKSEKFSGVYTLFSRLLLQGTKTRNAEQIATILENQAIELSTKCKQDYFKIDTMFLNEDADLALDIMADLLTNSTFEDFEKEVHKLKGEIKASLDNPRVKVTDEFVKNIFKGHYYANTSTKTLMDIDKITIDDVKDVLTQIMSAKKIVSVAGEIDDNFLAKVSKKLDFMRQDEQKREIGLIEPIKKSEITTLRQKDLNQAHIIQGWLCDTIKSEDYPKIVLMNNLLGASGLSSRLFYELRDRMGLAYNVRSSFDALKSGAVINFYIATTHANIQKSLDGFQTEIKKLQENLCSEDELLGAKENVLGRLDYFSQTNLQIASLSGYDVIMGLGENYETQYREQINSVTREDLTKMAQKYFSKNSIITILTKK